MNPFRGPGRYNILRVDIDGQHELYSKEELLNYFYRYISYPYPIILRDLDEVKKEEGLPDTYNLEINGRTLPLHREKGSDSKEPVCIFDEYMEDIIVDRAVELAMVGYKENSLQAQLMTNVRKE
jgi:hypothetical protein